MSTNFSFCLFEIAIVIIIMTLLRHQAPLMSVMLRNRSL